MTYQSSYFSQMDRQTEMFSYISEHLQVEHVNIIQDNWSRRLPLRHNNFASTGSPLKHIMGNEFNIIGPTIHFNIYFYIYNKLKQK